MAAPPGTGAAETIAVAVGLLAVDAALLVAHVRERSRRPAALDEADQRYYRDRDLRRGLGAAVMALAAVFMIAAARLRTVGDLAAARLYVSLWVGVLALIAALLGLALLDWLANRRFAARHRRQLQDERSALIAEAALEARRRRERRRGRGGPADPSWN